MKRRVWQAARELKEGISEAEPGKARLLSTRRAALDGWTAVAEQLDAQGESELAKEVRAFVSRMPPPMTEKEALKAALLERARVRDSRAR